MSLQDEKILGLTVYSPAAELIARGDKPIENRKWPPYKWMLGRYLAIHASPRYEQPWVDWVAGSYARFACDPPRREECTYGIIAVAHLVGWVYREPGETGAPKTIEMLPGYEFGSNVNQIGTSLDWRWFEGPYGWVLRDVVRIPPVACAGRQKLWKLNPFVKDSVKRRWAAAQKARAAAPPAGATPPSDGGSSGTPRSSPQAS